MDGNSWYIGINGQQEGPLATADVISRIQSGALTENAYVFTQGMATWTPIKTVRPFDQYFGGMQAPSLPPVPMGSASRADEIDFVITGEEMQFVEIELDPGEACISEAGALFYMDAEIQMKTTFGDGSKNQKSGLMEKAMSVGKRALTGESLALTEFTNNDHGRKRRAAFAAPYPGQIIPMDLAQQGGEILCQKDAFLVAAKGIKLDIAFQKKLGVGLFGGEGFILQKISGDGMAFLHAGGCIIARQLEPGETLKLDTGCVVAFQPSVEYDIEFVGGIANAVFGGEGLFMATLRGPGTIWIQSLPFSRLAGKVWAAAPQAGGQGVGEGSVLGKVGGMAMGDQPGSAAGALLSGIGSLFGGDD